MEVFPRQFLQLSEIEYSMAGKAACCFSVLHPLPASCNAANALSTVLLRVPLLAVFNKPLKNIISVGCAAFNGFAISTARGFLRHHRHKAPSQRLVISVLFVSCISIIMSYCVESFSLAAVGHPVGCLAVARRPNQTARSDSFSAPGPTRPCTAQNGTM